jgi:hypothetical protein
MSRSAASTKFLTMASDSQLVAKVKEGVWAASEYSFDGVGNGKAVVSIPISAASPIAERLNVESLDDLKVSPLLVTLTTS